MNQQQDTLSRSYTDSISSYLYNRMEETDGHSIVDHSNHSIRSFHTNGYTTPIIALAKDKSMLGFDDYRIGRSNSAMTDTASSQYHSFREEDSFYPSDNEENYCHQEEEIVTPLPKLQMLVISIILFSEPLTSTILFPFIYFMLKDFHLSDDEKEIGHYAGWITSVFFLAQFCTAIMWGRVSDRHGRRPVLLTGLVGNALSTSLFGLSKNLWWAIGARALCGIMNGNAGVARSMVSEITDSTNKAKAFSIFGFCWGAGMIGGYFCKPVEHFPSLFGNSLFLKEYPYFLPCFISSCGSSIGFIIGYFNLKESNPNVIASHKLKTENDEANERTALLQNHDRTEFSSKKAIVPKSGSMGDISKASYIIILSYSIFSFHAMIFDEVLPLYFTAPPYAGGLGFTAAEFAKVLSFFGIIQLIIQFVIYPKLTKRFSTLILCRSAFLLFIPIYLLFPELSTIRGWAAHAAINNSDKQNWLFGLTYITLLLFRFLGNCFSFTGLGIMVHIINYQLCQSCLALVRAMGPTFGGTLWSISLKDGNQFPFDRHLIYYIIAGMSLYSFFQSFSIPNSVALGGRRKQS
ncbi:MAG: major facilitator superfamily domain-containing protein [Benjaminiella poitrasii]|nr:MAG: major facilitator superfamily domain-containing protein [Benjaminiella poitrasii]